jgi:hypothetical protein
MSDRLAFAVLTNQDIGILAKRSSSRDDDKGYTLWRGCTVCGASMLFPHHSFARRVFSGRSEIVTCLPVNPERSCFYLSNHSNLGGSLQRSFAIPPTFGNLSSDHGESEA